MANKNNAKSFDAGKINFLSKSSLFAAVSIALVVISFVFMGLNGFNYGIDFAGGTEIQVKFGDQVQTNSVRSFTDGMGFKNASVQSIGDDSEYLIRMETVKGKTDKETNKLLNEMIGKVKTGLQATFGTAKPEVRRVDSVGPQIGEELKRNGLLAAFYCLLIILIYVGLRFDYKYAPGAVLCLFHDAVITLGIFAIFGREVNVQTMAAILTIIGYSLNDTIVTFDRVRENVGTFRDEIFPDVVNRAINDVLSRTLITSITTLIATSALYILADGVIKDLAFTLGVGIIVGTYSSIYVAAPLVVLADRMQAQPK